MKSFDDIADASTMEDIRSAENSRGRYTIEADGAVEADEIGTDDFPQYGYWLEVEPLDGGPEEELMDATYIEVPGGLAKVLQSQGASAGDELEIRSVRKGAGGRWVYSAEVTPES